MRSRSRPSSAELVQTTADAFRRVPGRGPIRPACRARATRCRTRARPGPVSGRSRAKAGGVRAGGCRGGNPGGRRRARTGSARKVDLQDGMRAVGQRRSDHQRDVRRDRFRELERPLVGAVGDDLGQALEPLVAARYSAPPAEARGDPHFVLKKKKARRSGGRCGGPSNCSPRPFVARYAPEPRFASPSADDNNGTCNAFLWAGRPIFASAIAVSRFVGISASHVRGRAFLGHAADLSSVRPSEPSARPVRNRKP